jgi:hypothetical protein
MWNKLAALTLAGACAVAAQDGSFDPHSSIQINLPPDSPVSLLTTNVGESRATPRGGAMVVDLHMSLSLRNSGSRNIRGVTLLVTTQEMTPGGKASVAVPSLNVSPGQTFPVRIDLRLLRPLQAGAGPLVKVGLDGVLFEGFEFYGPNRLNSRRAMRVWEVEAERDRRHFQTVLATTGGEALRREMLESLARQAEQPRIDVRVSRGAAVTSVVANERLEHFAFLKVPDAPIEAIDGFAEVAGNEARTPRIRVMNRSSKPVRYLEIGWIVKDTEGYEFLAGSVPASEGDLLLAPGQTGRALQDTALRFSRNAGEPVSIASMTGFVSQVEFADETVWVPNRAALERSGLLRVVAPSPEEQRLVDLYRTKGLSAVMEELRKF